MDTLDHGASHRRVVPRGGGQGRRERRGKDLHKRRRREQRLHRGRGRHIAHREPAHRRRLRAVFQRGGGRGRHLGQGPDHGGDTGLHGHEAYRRGGEPRGLLPVRRRRGERLHDGVRRNGRLCQDGRRIHRSRGYQLHGMVQTGQPGRGCFILYPFGDGRR